MEKTILEQIQLHIQVAKMDISSISNSPDREFVTASRPLVQSLGNCLGALEALLKEHEKLTARVAELEKK